MNVVHEEDYLGFVGIMLLGGSRDSEQIVVPPKTVVFEGDSKEGTREMWRWDGETFNPRRFYWMGFDTDSCFSQEGEGV